MYNEGRLHGMWLKLPITDEELQSALTKIGIGGRYEETFITDYENDLGLKVDEYESLSVLNEVAECISCLNEHEVQVLRAVIEMHAPSVSTLVDLIGTLDNYTLHADIKTYRELGHYLIHDVGNFNLYEVETLSNYLDYESYGYDYNCNSAGELTSYGWLER